MLTATSAWFEPATNEVFVETNDGNVWEILSLIDDQLIKLGYAEPSKWFESHPLIDALWSLYDELMEN